MASREEEESPELVDQFVAVTGATQAVAFSMLEACGGNLDLAVGMHIDGQAMVGSSSVMQEDLTSLEPNNHVSSESNTDVRAPIPQKTEVLIDDDENHKLASWRMRRPRRMVRSVFDGFRDFQAEAKNYEDEIHGRSTSKKRNLEDLFRPPVDITHKGTFQSACNLGSSNNQWLLVNVQNVQEFECQVLNRDVWSCHAAKKLIGTNFIFWQVYNDSAEGKRFMQFYKVSGWPYVAIVDPFTGESQIAWRKISDGNVFCELANEFLAIHPTPNKCDSGSPPNKRQKLETSIVDASEQDQMQAAIQASLQETEAKSNNSPLFVIDSDSEPDVIEDSDDDLEAFSDSDSIVESTRVNRKSAGQSRKTTFTSTLSSTSTSSSSSSLSASWCSSKPNTNQITSDSCNASVKKNHKDPHFKHKSMLSSNKPFCSFAYHGFSPDICGDYSRASTSSSKLDTANTTPIIKADLSVDADDSFLDGPEIKNSEVCTLNNSHCRSHVPDVTRLQNATSTHSLNWKFFWGQETDPMSKIMVRFPNSQREQVELPCSSSLKALKTYCASRGFTEDKYELVTNFPRRQLSEIDDTKVLKDIGLYPQDTVFVQEL